MNLQKLVNFHFYVYLNLNQGLGKQSILYHGR